MRTRRGDDGRAGYPPAKGRPRSGCSSRGARPSRERGRPRRGVALPLRPRRGVALPRGATIGCVPINLNPLNPLNLLNTLNPLNLLNLLNHQDRYLAEM